ncbi:hypothetical protein LMH87_000776 [Akanthomyces muscarius]|uniref:Uncharacterized protein n=1 Tax=Akanthomyces muscarius TaxID=2231603 RepID=A0A9W8QHI3_AKAMU|nr:hypothetical protein LMH87_000776 [Akanthomyces muscarius]KAJ4155537.1 hypothetical protein LMH87_000776 [Akanthomyces muscarius]
MSVAAALRCDVATHACMMLDCMQIGLHGALWSADGRMAMVLELVLMRRNCRPQRGEGFAAHTMFYQYHGFGTRQSSQPGLAFAETSFAGESE